MFELEGNQVDHDMNSVIVLPSSPTKISNVTILP